MPSDYFKDYIEKDAIGEDDLNDLWFEFGMFLVLILYFGINLFTDFFLESVGPLVYLAIFFPFILAVLRAPLHIKIDSKQKLRPYNGLSNIIMGLCWIYLALIERWYDASKLFLLGSFISNQIFRWFILGGVIFPIPIGLSSLFLYFGIKRDQERYL